jgi:putative oxidoreductase
MTTNSESQSEMKSEVNASTSGRLAVAARIVLGLIFGVSGANHIFQLVPMPPMTGDTAVFWQGLEQTGYFFPLLGIVELGAGASLAAGWLVPLAMTLVAPIIVNIVFFHALLAPAGLGITALVMASALVVLRSHRTAFRPVLAAHAEAHSVRVRAVEVLLGVIFVASGVAGAFSHTPPAATAGAALMMNGLAASGYFLPLLSGVQIAAGGLLVARRYVGIALMALAPVVVEIAAYRLYVASATPGMLVVAAALVAATVGLAVAHRRMFALWAAS